MGGVSGSEPYPGQVKNPWWRGFSPGGHLSLENTFQGVTWNGGEIRSNDEMCDRPKGGKDAPSPLHDCEVKPGPGVPSPAFLWGEGVARPFLGR